MKDLTFADAPQYVYNEKSFKEAAAAEGTLIMLADITVSSTDEGLNLSKNLTIQGNHTLTVQKEQMMPPSALPLLSRKVPNWYWMELLL